RRLGVGRGWRWSRSRPSQDRAPWPVRRTAFEHTHPVPAVVAPFDGLIVAVALGQIAPATTRAGHPDPGVDKASVVGARAASALATTRHRRLNASPLLIVERIDIHDCPPKDTVESHLCSKRNPLIGHYDLDLN